MAARLQLVPITVAAAVHLLGTGVACHLPLAMVPGFLAAVWLAWLLSWRLQFLPARSALFVAWGTVAFAWTLMVVHPPAPRDLANILEEPREHLTLSGSVAAEPFSRVFQEDADPVWFVPLEIDRVRRTPQWQRASGRLLLSVRDGDLGEKLAYGDRVTVAGAVRRQVGPYFGLMKSRYRMYVDADELAIRSGGRSNPLLAWCFSQRKRLADVLGQGIRSHPREIGIAQALLLGYRTEMDPELNQQFARTGTLHIFAISGLHVGMLAMLVIFVLKRCGLSRMYWILLLAPILVVFVISTGMKASAVRACLMAILYWGAPFLRRQPNVLTALSLAVIIVLILSPLQFDDPGFLFSFAIVAGMIVLVPPMHHALTAWIRTDDWAPEGADPRARRLRNAATGLMDYLAVSTSAWLISVPLTALIFHMFTPIALIGNVFAVFFAFVIVVTGMVSMLVGTLWLPLAGILNVLLQKEIAVLLWIIEGLSECPGAWQYVESPPVLAVLIYYALLTGLVWRGRLDRVVPVTLLVAVIAWSVFSWQRHARLRMDVLDVEPGQALYLDLPGDHHVLIDTGPARLATLTFRALQARGVDRIDVLVLTHSDPNHVGAARALFKEYPVGACWVPVKYGTSKVFAETLEAAKAAGIPLRFLQAGDHGTFRDALDYHVFYPGPETDIWRADDLSLVMRLSVGSQAVLITGGAGPAVEQRLLAQPVEPAAPIYIVPNNPEWSAVSTAWLRRIQPRSAVLAGSRFNQITGRTDRITNAAIALYRVDRFGPVRVDLKTGAVAFLEP